MAQGSDNRLYFRRQRNMCHLGLCLVLLLWIQIANSQDPALTLQTGGPYQCGSSLIFRCTPSSCCGSISKIWYKDTNTQIISGGTSIDSTKYTETVTGSSYFEMTIMNLAKTDFDIQYSCFYGGSRSNYITLNSTDITCSDKKTGCGTCACFCWLFSLIIPLLMVLILAILCCFNKTLKDLMKGYATHFCIDGLFIFLLTALGGLLLGGLQCFCEDGVGRAPWCILWGLIAPILTGILLFYAYKHPDKKKGSSASNSSPGTGTGTGPSKKDSKPVKKEKKENSPAHVKTDNTTPRSKLDDVPLHRPLPQIGGTTSPSTTGHPDPDKRNITKLPPMEMTSESEEKKKKKKKKKKQSDGLANDGYDD